MFAACDRMPRSPMMTVSGIAAEGPPAVDETRRIAAECVSPQLTAVLGPDTELRFAVIPVMMNVLFENSSAKILIISKNLSCSPKYFPLKNIKNQGLVKWFQIHPILYLIAFLNLTY